MNLKDVHGDKLTVAKGAGDSVFITLECQGGWQGSPQTVKDLALYLLELSTPMLDKVNEELDRHS